MKFLGFTDSTDYSMNIFGSSLTCSRTAIFLTIQRNSHIEHIKAIATPVAKTTKTPPTLSSPNSAAVSSEDDSSSLKID